MIMGELLPVCTLFTYHESAGLQVHHQNDGSAADFNIPIGAVSEPKTIRPVHGRVP